MEVYFDNSATTRCSDAVVERVTQAMTECYGNPSSMHRKGFEAEKELKEAKKILADILRVQEKELIFTSGGTESNNLAIIGSALANQRAGKHLITSSIEHPAVLNVMHALEEQGFSVTYLPVDAKGSVRLDELERVMTEDTILVSIMMVNNEIGSLQPLQKISSIIRKKNPNCLFHVDAVQGFGKFRIAPKRMGIDMLSVSGHKIHGPKGVGLLYVDERVKIRPVLFGGGQQKNLRSGTENVPGIAGLAAAAKECYEDFDAKQEQLFQLREKFLEDAMQLEGVTLNGPEGREGAPHIVSLSFRGIRSEVLLHSLEDRGIYVSAGSACASNKPGISATLKSIGMEKDLLDSTIRFSFSVYNTPEEAAYCIEALKQILPLLRRYARH